MPFPTFRFTTVLGSASLEIWSGGFVQFETHPTNHRHLHTSYHELCIVTAGKGQFTHGERSYPLRAGDVFVSELHVPHEISSLRTRDLRLTFVCFSVERLPGSGKARSGSGVVERFLNGHTLCAPSRGRLEPWLDILSRGNEGAFAAERCETAARMLVLEAMDILARAPDENSASPQSPDTFARAVEFIERNIGRQFSVEELARHCACSSRQLRRVFVSRTGQRLMETVNERRMRLAAQQLLMRFTAGQVAESLGFSSAAHFTRLFARYHGVTPKRYQIQHAPKGTLPRTEF